MDTGSRSIGRFGTGARPDVRLTALIPDISNVLVAVTLPFVVGTIHGGTNKLTILIVGLMLMPMITFQVYNQGIGLKALERACGAIAPQAIRETVAAIASTTYSLCWASTIQNAAILLALRSNDIRVDEGRPEGALFNVALIVASILVVTGIAHRAVKVAIAVSPIILFGLALRYDIDIVTVSTWQTMFTIVCAVILLSVQAKEIYLLANAMASRAPRDSRDDASGRHENGEPMESDALRDDGAKP